MIVRSLAPMRLGLAGGGTDIDAFADVHGGYVLNVSINKNAITTINDEIGNIICFKSDDMKCEVCYKIEDDIIYDKTLDLHKAAYLYFMKTYNGGKNIPMSVTTFCDAPTGSGLGASSTLMVSLVHAFAEYFNIGLGEYELASLAFKIERNELGLAGGKQDQYAAAFGGFNFMEFYEEGRVIINPLRVKDHVVAELESSILLYYSGLSRESANVIDEQKKQVKSKNTKSVDALLELKNQAQKMKESILTGNLNGVVDAINVGWKAKKESSSKVSSSYLNEIYDKAIKAGAKAGKISGAGGGGFFMFYVPPEGHQGVIDALKPYGGFFLNCTFKERGSFSWKVK